MIRWTYAFIDRPAERFEAARAFWTSVTDTHLSALRGDHGEFATLVPSEAHSEPASERASEPASAALSEAPSKADACLKIQAVGDEGGAHLDLSVEDVPELKRSALSLGAELVLDEGDFAVLRSPAGQLFCGVTWDGEKVRPAAAVGPGGVRTRLDQVCIDLAPDLFDAEVSFWAALTGWESYTSSHPEFHVLHPPAGLPIRVLLQRIGDDRPVRSHLDLSCTEVDAARAWHESHGASCVERFPGWTVMRDPAGGVYCLTSRDPDTGRSAG